MTKNSYRYLSVIIITLFTINSSYAQIADRVFTNAKIYTSNDAQPLAEALAIKSDSILYVGSTAGAQSHIGSGTIASDMNGKLMLPGIHDVHQHPMEASSTAGASCFFR
tara:strand:+ start:472 stop:798 length:327 start_codon:yes stop_codon:yes gene_type:complete